MQQQRVVLWEGSLSHQLYGEVTTEVTFAQPVLVSGIRAASASTAAGLQLPQLLKGHAADLQAPTAARFSLLFNAVSVPRHGTQEYSTDKVFPTQRVWLRGRCHSVTVQLLGYQLNEAPQQIQAAAEVHFGALPEASPLLSLPSTPQQHCQLQPQSAPSLPRPAGKQLPLGKIPPAFVLTLAPLAQFWGKGLKIPLPPGSSPLPDADLRACDGMAQAVLAAQRGSPAALQAKLALTRNMRGLAVDWDGIRDSVLDMATYCCSALGDNISAPADMALASAGVSAAIMLAACQDGAAQFLAWPNGGVGVAGAIAVRDLVSIPNQPGRWQECSMGLVELLLESCPAVAGPTLQGTLNPAGIPEPQQDADTTAAAPAADEAAVDVQDGPMPEARDSEGVLDGGTGEPGAVASGEAQGGDAPGSDSGDAGPAAEALPAAKRQRVAGGAGAPGDCTDIDAAAGGVAAAAAAADAGLLHAESTTGNAAAAALADAGASGVQPHQEPTQEGVQQADDGDSSDEGGALLAGLGQDGSDGWDPEDDDDGARGGGQQQDGGSSVQQQEVALEEGDYPEADEDAIRAEAAAKAARRGVERRPPVCALGQGQLYGAVLQLAMAPMKHTAAVSCMSVLRRLRAYQCMDTIQATAGAWLSGKVDPAALSPAELCAQVRLVAAAAQDLAALVLQPPAATRSLFLYDPPEGQQPAGSSLSEPQQQQEADYCVLQLLLSFRVLELLAAVNCCVGVHTARLAQQQHRHQPLQQQHDEQQGNAQVLHPEQQPPEQLRQQPAPEQPTDPPDCQPMNQAAEQQEQLCREHAQLLDSIRALTSALTASSGGWSFLAAARDGLAALATAVCPTRQVSLDGGPFSPDSSVPYDPQQGWQAERQALLAAAAGQSGSSEDTAHAAAAGELADSLQRLWLLVEGTAQLQGAEDVLSGKDRTPGAADRLDAALKTLFVGGFASELGRQSLVSALSACSPAVRQLGVLLQHSSQVLAAAAPGAKDQGPGNQGDNRLVYGALYAPEVLLAFVSSPHLDAIAAWLPQTAFLHDIVREQLHQHDVSATAAARAAFPDLLATDAAAAQAGGLPTTVLPGGAAAAKERSEQVLLQLHGVVLTAHTLLQEWQEGDAWAPAGAGSSGKLLKWLHSQLPRLESVVQRSSAVIDPEGVAPTLPKTASAALAALQAADSTSQLDGAAAAGGAAPPAGRDVKSEAVVEFMHNAACRSAALCALHLIDMLLQGAPGSVRHMACQAARKARKGSKATAPAFVPVRQQDGSFASGDASDAVGAAGPSTQQQYDGFAIPEVVRELLEGVAVKPSPDSGLVQVEVFELLERALRTATVALRSADADLLWSVRGGGQEDILAVLEARTAAVALMRAACTTTASLLVHLSDADPQQEAQRLAVENDSLLDALLCAHSAVVTSREGLQACAPHPQLAPFIARATDPSLTPTQRSAADAAVSGAAARVGNSRVLLLLEARQALAVCLRCWQLQGWRPDPVGALLGVFPHASDALEGFAKEDAAARKEGDPSAPPPPAPRQGPRQLLSSLLGLADLCPDEWPARGASHAAARQRDAAAAADKGAMFEGSPFERPSLILLRQKVAAALEAQWDRLEGLIGFGLACSTRLARLALVRMLARMAGLGAGMAPLLGPKVLLALCGCLHKMQQLRKGLADRLHDIACLAAPDADKQALVEAEVNTLHLQVLAASQVCEVLLPLCAAPAIKAVLLEHKAAGILAKAVYAVVTPQPDLQHFLMTDGAAAANGSPGPGPALRRVDAEGQSLAGLLLQLVGVLMDPDISMNPWADRANREMQDTPTIFTSSVTAAWLLAAAPHLSPANMVAVAQLLVGSRRKGHLTHNTRSGQGDPAAIADAGADASAAATGHAAVPAKTGAAAAATGGLLGSAKGRAVLLRVGRQWQLLDQSLQEAQERAAQARLGGVPLNAAPAQQHKAQQAPGLTQAELQASAVWAAGVLDATCCAGGCDPSHAASCAAVAQVLRGLAGSSAACAAAWQEHEGVVAAEEEMVPELSWIKFVDAARLAAASHTPGGPDQQSISTLLTSPPLLLACDACCLDFWDASAAAATRAASCPPPATSYRHAAAQPTATASSWWLRPQLIGGSSRGARSQAIEEVVQLAQDEQQRRRQQLEAGSREEGGADDGAGGFIPAVYAQRGPQFLKDDRSRKASMHVDDYQRQAAEKKQRQQEQQEQQRRSGGMHPPPPRPLLPGGGSNVLKPGAVPLPPVCDLCGEEGHLARECKASKGPGGPLGGPPASTWDGGPWGRRPPGPPPGGSTSICYHCGEVGHFARECTLGPPQCFNCGELGHLARDCQAPRGTRGAAAAAAAPPPPPPPRGGPPSRLAPVQQQHQPQLLSPSDSGGPTSPPSDPRLRRQQQRQGSGAAGPLGGLGSGRVPPGLGLAPAAGQPAAAGAGAGAAAGGGNAEADADAEDDLLLWGLGQEGSDDAGDAAGGGVGGQGQFAGGQEADVDDLDGIGGFLDELMGGGMQEDEEGSDGEGPQCGVSEVGGL